MTNFSDKLKALSLATKGDIYDHEYKGGVWMHSEVETQETLADFEAASRKYAECSKPLHGEIAGMQFLAFAKVQARKGDVRQSLSIIDFGDRRIAINENLNEFI